MKVYIGPYVNRWISTVYDCYMVNKYGYNDWPEYDVIKGLTAPIHEPIKEIFLRKLEDTLQWIYDHSINLYLDTKPRKIKLKIHKYDTWSMDETLSLIILPMLKQLKDTKHGAPYVDNEDVPPHLRAVTVDEHQTDDTHFQRWDWVIDEMIWAFEQKNRDDWQKEYYGEWIDDPDEPLGGNFKTVDYEGMQKRQDRMANGFILFGKYYESLWD